MTIVPKEAAAFENSEQFACSGPVRVLVFARSFRVDATLLFDS